MRARPGTESGQELGHRSPTFRPDRVTALPGAVGYFEVFSPSITPYKRISALDGVALDGATPVLAVATGTRTPVALEGAASRPPDARARDRFWGTVVLDFSDGGEVPLPSVSPESRLLTLRTEPQVAMHVERDRADNFYAVLDQPRARQVRVTFLTDAPRTYFGFDDGAELPRAPSDALIAEVPVLPERVERDALTFAHEIGLSRGQRFDIVLRRLAEHFRAFEESEEPPTDTGHIFLDLARGMRGVCRHRAYAFVIVAMALGIPARFVSNEAHAWVEVHMPERRGWLRIDLGGSARGLVEHDATHGPAYTPDVRDLLPQPAAFSASRPSARASTSGGGASSRASASTSSASSASSSAEEGTSEPSTPPPPDPNGMDVLDLRPAQAPRPPRAPLALALDRGHFRVVRGQTFEVTGTATSMGAPAPGVRIEVLLASPAEASERLLGVTVTDARGVFHASFGIPPDESVGERALVVRSPASTRYEAASVE
jgi:hypothetical protein